MQSTDIKRMLSKQKGITGLETAIILIAFVVVASVFAYSVLSAGLFTSQKSKEAVHSGLKETQATLEMRGAVIARGEVTSNGSGNVTELSFTLGKTMGGDTIDFTGRNVTANSTGNVVVISYTDKYQRKDDLNWSTTWLGNSDGDDIMEEDEKVQIAISGLANNTTANHLDPPLQASTQFVLEVKPPQGPILRMDRKTPDSLDPVMILN